MLEEGHPRCGRRLLVVLPPRGTDGAAESRDLVPGLVCLDVGERDPPARHADCRRRLHKRTLKDLRLCGMEQLTGRQHPFERDPADAATDDDRDDVSIMVSQGLGQELRSGFDGALTRGGDDRFPLGWIRVHRGVVPEDPEPRWDSELVPSCHYRSTVRALLHPDRERPSQLDSQSHRATRHPHSVAYRFVVDKASTASDQLPDCTVRRVDMGAQFLELHRSGTFVMVNVADAGTARAVCEAGAAAVATTSGGHAATIGRLDASGDVTMEEHALHTELLVTAASVPCNVDAENAYGHEPEDMADAVRRFAATGAAGMGIEDWSGTKDIGLYDRSRAIARIEAAVEAARALDNPFVITGRTEVLLYGLDGGMDETLARLQGFAAVGAHCLFAPGTWDLQSIRTVTEGAGGPVNVLVPLSEVNPRGPVSFGLADLAEVGVRRVSLGGSLYRAQVIHAAERVRTLLADGVL